MAATPKRTLTVDVRFTVDPSEVGANEGHVVDALMAVLDDLTTAGAEPPFTITRARWLATHLEDKAK